MSMLKIILTDGRKLEINNPHRSIARYILEAKEMGMIIYASSVDETWLIPYHSILMVQEDK